MSQVIRNDVKNIENIYFLHHCFTSMFGVRLFHMRHQQRHMLSQKVSNIRPLSLFSYSHWHNQVPVWLLQQFCRQDISHFCYSLTLVLIIVIILIIMTIINYFSLSTSPTPDIYPIQSRWHDYSHTQTLRSTYDTPSVILLISINIIIIIIIINIYPLRCFLICFEEQQQQQQYI